MKLNIDKTVLNFLIDFGLTEKEITVYMTLLKTGPNTIMNLARETGIKRSTTHNTVEELIKKGLVSQTNYGERRMVIAEDPEKLSFLMDQKKWDITKLEKNLPDVVKQIQVDIPSNKNEEQVEVKYFTGTTGIGLIYKEALNTKELRSYANVSKILQALPDNSGLFQEAHKKNKSLQLWEIVEDSDESRKYTAKFDAKSRYQYKISPVSLTAGALDILIYDNKVSIITFNEGITGVVIYNKDYYNNSKALFDYIWQTL